MSFFVLFFFLLIRLPHRSTLFPYTTLFRSRELTDLPAAVGELLPLVGCEEAELGGDVGRRVGEAEMDARQDRKSTRLNSSHLGISYAVFCLKKKTYERPQCELVPVIVVPEL